MKITPTISISGRIVLLIGFFLAIVPQLFAQQCGISATVPDNFATWNWEEPERNPNSPSTIRTQYCNTWAASVSTGTSVTRYSMGAPWIAPSSPALQQIGLTEDYRRSGGWELLKMNFGGRGNVTIPYFVLYNKATGIVRVYAYIVNTNLLTGVAFTMGHSAANQQNSGHGTSLVSLAQPYIVAPDKYITQPSTDKEVITYVSFYGGPQAWAMGQFTMMFDPNTANSAFNLSSYQFQIYGITRSDMTLNGSLQFKTNASADSDFSFGGPASVPDASGALVISATGQKFLGDLSSVATKLQDINKKAADFTALMTNNPSSALNAAASANNKAKSMANSSNVTGGQTLNGLTNLLGQFGAWFSLAGSVMTVFSDLTGNGSSKSSFIPTFSKGTITMSGTITTTSPLVTFYLMAPGTNHNPSGGTPPVGLSSNLPYYNCPLGIFNIKNTPILQKVDYRRNVAVYYANSNYNNPYPFTYPAYPADNPSYTSYRITNNIMPVVNAASGLEIVSVKFAIAQKIPFSQLLRPYEVQTPYTAVGNERRVYNFTYAQVAKGVLEAYPLDPGTSASDATMILQTPFMDAGCLGSTTSIPFNIPTPDQSNPVFLRVVAELKNISSPATAPHTYFSQDYAVDVVNGPNPGSYSTNSATAFNDPGPYHVESMNGYTPYSTVPNDFYEPNIVQSATNYTYIYGGSYLSEIANNALLFTSGTNTSILPNSSSPVLFHAASSIGIEGQLSVPLGASFVMSTDFKSPAAAGQYACDYSPSGYSVANQSCGFDVNATRGVLATQLTNGDQVFQLIVAPNPATGSTVVRLRMQGKECIQRLSLTNLAGQNLWNKDYECTNAISAEIPLAHLPQGIYIVRAITSGRTYSTKLSVN